MPRIYNSRNDSYDFCQACFPSEDDAFEEYGNDGNGPDNRGNCFAYDSEHPPYDGENYCCEECGCELIKEDD